MFQELHVLFFTLEEDPLTFLARATEVNEAVMFGLAEDVRGWGREPEDVMDVVK